jgi:hypothetical protein
MSIRADSFSSTGEVIAFTRYLLAGQTAFNSTTQPTGTAVEKFIDRASGVLNVALAASGFDPTNIRANSTAKLACDDWVTARAVEYVELTQRGAGFNESEGSRYIGFRNLNKAAGDFCAANSLGFKRLGVAAAHPLSEGLAFTGLTAQADRLDPTDTSLEQPFFRRGQFDEPATSRSDLETSREDE